jgi:hypothetical protein
MDQERTLETAELRAAMESTRTSLRETVSELKGRVSEAMDWRTYLDRHAGAALVGATVLGILVGRAAASRLGGASAEMVQGMSAAGSGYLPAVSAASERPGSLMRMSDSWSRAGSRVEGIVNRVIDELADLVEHGALPALMSRIRSATRLEREPDSRAADFRFHAANR